MTPNQIHSAIIAAEKKIQSILLDLVNEHSLKLEHVRVDVRTFADFKVEILTAPIPHDYKF